MSGIINKVKEAVSGHKNSDHSEPEGTHGPHNSRAANAADPRIDSDRDGRADPHTSAHGTHTTTHGTHGTTGSGLTGTHGTTGSGLTGSNYNTSTNAGPHDSNAANKLDPRVDSDRDGSRTAAGNTYGSSGVTGTHGTHGTHGTTGSGLTGTHGTHGTTGYNSSTNAGPHNSNAMNAVDPRVDSDRDGSRTVGGNQYGTTTGSGLTGTHGTHGTTGSGLTGSHGTTGSGLTGTHGTHGTHGTTGYNSSTNAGPHDSNAANKLDPRVDSDRDGSRTAAGNQYGTTTGSGLTGTHGTHGTTGSGLTGSHGTTGSGLTGTHGTHNTHGTHGVTGAHTGPGPAPNTAGPHKSDALNKLDPRVDSDRDGSKTLGQDKTYSADARKDPTDAAQVPPSTLRKHIGEPTIAHDDHHHGRERRNSSVTAQESHRGL